jgi:hypothetical protein
MRQLGPERKPKRATNRLPMHLGRLQNMFGPWHVLRQNKRENAFLSTADESIDAPRQCSKIILRSSLADSRVVQKTTIEQENKLPPGGTRKFSEHQGKPTWENHLGEISFLPPR